MDKDKVELIHSATYTESDHLYLGLTYRIENDRAIREFTIPKIDLGIRTDDATIDEMKFLVTEYGNLPLMRQTVTGLDKYEKPFKAHNVRFVDVIKKDKYKKMTLSEIEDELGHKIELVSESEDEEND